MYLINGPVPVTELMHHLEVSQSNLSNHLAVLKNAGLIKSVALGRQKIYEVANPAAAQLIEMLLNMQHITPKKAKAIKPIQFARTCYDHLAGKLGVAVFEALIKEKAIRFTVDGTMKDSDFSAGIELDSNAKMVFDKLGIDLSLLPKTNRRFAFGCRDWTEKTPHLAGALGALVCNSFFEKKWVTRKDESRTLVLTTSGKQNLKNLLGLEMVSE
jgi:DNA-binding transcriptional ArsR family regulator